MSNIVLNPDIANLEPNSLKEKMYTRMYTSFFTAQIQKSPSNPNGISEGDLTSIALRNSAYTFADIIGDSIEIGAAGVEIDVSNLVKKDGDSMIGKLIARLGFSAGENGVNIISTFADQDGISGVDLDGVLRISGSLLLNGRDIISRELNTTTISDDNLKINAKKIDISGDNIDINGIVFKNGDIISVDKAFYHSKNSNLPSIDWQAKNIKASSSLSVVNGMNVDSEKFSVLSKSFSIGKYIYSDSNNTVNFDHPISINGGLMVNKKGILEINGSNIAIGYEDGNLVLGTDKTKDVRINKGLKSWNGMLEIISRSGYGSFSGFESGHDLSSPVIKTDKDGVIFSKNILIGGEKLVSLSSENKKMLININGGVLETSYLDSDSAYKPQNKPSKTHFIKSNGDFISFDNQIESSALNIRGSETRISNGTVNISKSRYIEDSSGGMVVHGDMRFLDTISTQQYASGYGGNGWVITRDALSGMTSMSIDEVTVRRKMRIYEMEIQKTSATNGALWVTNNMAADIVERII